jgi:hypothetical protein
MHGGMQKAVFRGSRDGEKCSVKVLAKSGFGLARSELSRSLRDDDEPVPSPPQAAARQAQGKIALLIGRVTTVGRRQSRESWTVNGLADDDGDWAG